MTMYLMQMAMESDFTEYINPNDESFLAPDNMIEAIKNYLGKPELPIGDVLNSVYHSLAITFLPVYFSVSELR